MVKIQHFRSGNELNPENVIKIQERLERYDEEKEHPEIPPSQDQEAVKEKVRETLKSMGREEAKKTSDLPSADKERDQTPFLPDYMKKNDGDWDEKEELEIVSRLISEALDGDILGALKTASRLPPHLEDAVHDAILEKVIPKLKETGSFK